MNLSSSSSFYRLVGYFCDRQKKIKSPSKMIFNCSLSHTYFILLGKVVSTLIQKNIFSWIKENNNSFKNDTYSSHCNNHGVSNKLAFHFNAKNKVWEISSHFLFNIRKNNGRLAIWNILREEEKKNRKRLNYTHIQKQTLYLDLDNLFSWKRTIIIICARVRVNKKILQFGNN